MSCMFVRMKMHFVKYVFLLVLIPAILQAQESAKVTKAQKKADKKKEQLLEKQRKAELKGKQRHYKLQDRQTRKRMRKHRKRVDQHYPGDRPGFFKRLFGKKNYYIYLDNPGPDRAILT